VSEPLVLSLAEAAKLLSITPSQLYSLTRERSQCRRAHRIPVIRLGKRLAFRRESLIAWLAASETGGAR
jgi:excisionase family DNA binding protein